MARRGPGAAASIVLLCWTSLAAAAQIGPGVGGTGMSFSRLQLQLATQRDDGSIRSLGGRDREIASRSRTQPAQPVLTRVCIPCLVGVARPPAHTRGLVATEREERERLVPARTRPRVGRRPASARTVPSSQLQAKRSGESDLRGASARQDIPYSAPLLRAPPLVLG